MTRPPRLRISGLRPGMGDAGAPPAAGAGGGTGIGGGGGVAPRDGIGIGGGADACGAGGGAITTFTLVFPLPPLRAERSGRERARAPSTVPPPALLPIPDRLVTGASELSTVKSFLTAPPDAKRCTFSAALARATSFMLFIATSEVDGAKGTKPPVASSQPQRTRGESRDARQAQARRCSPSSCGLRPSTWCRPRASSP